MAVIHEDRGTTPEGHGYRWTLEDTDNDGSRVTVAIDKWGESHDYPVVLSKPEAAKVAERLARELWDEKS